MKKYLKYTWIIAILMLVTAALPSCRKQINMTPENATYDDVFWVDGPNVEKALSGSYVMLRDAFRQDRSFFIFGDIAADNFLPGADYWNYTSFLQSGKFNFNYAPYLEISVKNWSRFYAIITQCHQIIENAPRIPDSKFSGGSAQKNRFIGEARFLRAYVYFYMQRVWGDVILTKETFKDPQNIPPAPRSPESETLAFCLSDLQSASAMLDNSANKTHANKVSALALLAQVYAWKKDYANTEKYCDSVINSSPVALEQTADYKKIWEGNSQESILELNMRYNAVSNEGTDEFFGVFLNNDYIRDKNILSSGWVVSEGSLALFEQDEIRKGMILEDAGDSETMLTKYTNVNYYDPNNSSSYVVSNNLVLIRLADTYLLRAEARFKNGRQGDALSDLNVIRGRAGLAAYETLGTDLFNEIADERRREFIGEGSNQFDLIRMEQFTRLFDGVYTADRIAKKGYFWPLDMRTLLKSDELLTQNEWWNNN
jgi:hypothetical protein